MMGSFLSRVLLMVFGYAYPAYECFKAVEKNKPRIDQLTFWCQYWILVALLTVCERFGDALVSWLPMYGEAKLALFIYLWHTKTKGTSYVYSSFLQPVIAKHEKEIDHRLSEMRDRSWAIVIVHLQKAAAFWQARFFEMLQFVSAQSVARRPQPASAPAPAPAPAQVVFTDTVSRSL